MSSSAREENIEQQMQGLLGSLASHPQSQLIERSLAALSRIAGADTERLNWKILTASLEDLEQGFQRFYPYRHTRKIAIFGSARTSPQQAEYQSALEFARRIAQAGFMVITGAGGGIM
ncbi:MAG: cytochrome D ubiquinol oxidase subunit II, partial [Cyanobacteria bacterium J06623_7]